MGKIQVNCKNLFELFYHASNKNGSLAREGFKENYLYPAHLLNIVVITNISFIRYIYDRHDTLSLSEKEFASISEEVNFLKK